MTALERSAARPVESAAEKPRTALVVIDPYNDTPRIARIVDVGSEPRQCERPGAMDRADLKGRIRAKRTSAQGRELKFEQRPLPTLQLGKL
jgi:hypothetical protein